MHNRKTLYKVELLYVKISPMLISLGILLCSILSYLNVDISIVGGYIYGVSLLTTTHMYISSYLYKFCAYHRMFLHYIVISNILYLLDYYIKIPLSDRNLFLLHIIIAGVFLFLILYYYTKRHKDNAENNQKTLIENY